MTNLNAYTQIANADDELTDLQKHPSLKGLLEINTIILTAEQKVHGAQIKVSYRNSFNFVDYLHTLFEGEGFEPKITIAQEIYWQYKPTLEQVLRVKKVKLDDYERTKPLLQELDPNYEQTLTKPVQVLAPAKLFCIDHELTVVCSYWAVKGIVHVLQIFADQVRECGSSPQCNIAATLTALGDKYTNEYRQKELELAEQEIAKLAERYNLPIEAIKSAYCK